jgi:hypothetical protein
MDRPLPEITAALEVQRRRCRALVDRIGSLDAPAVDAHAQELDDALRTLADLEAEEDDALSRA